ncbi:glycosyltransferase 87 family protein [Streptomyces parvulus]|uniref:glycosyltransferase 87 family protein n=1 Tax=Streptomyces parvulus TaxID=146923 RepID=UPI001E5458B0|nr:glycosyltransferase 87 family protein [Streptomyces parvulus]MCC9156572.1 glycosyltransferase 87 family protein [Streptomyces parvulus]MCE7685859.1 glycosyltransferase 87 family protein [Streptomyces parvulus]
MGKSEGRRFAAEPAGRLERYGWAGCAVVAPGFAMVSDQAAHRVWGWTAGIGYALAALLSSGPRTRPAARAAAVLGAVLVPLAGLVAAGVAQSEVAVVERSGRLLLATGSPYLSQPVAVGDFNPYLPGMAVFGVLPGDARWWLGGVFAVCLAGVGLSRAALLACPLVALPFAVGGVDLPVVGLMCLGVVLAGRGRPGRAGLALGAAAALKWTAWPALPVALVLVTAARGGRSALRYAATGSGTAAAVVLPFVLIDPAGFQRNVVAFPLGLTSAASPAESPLPGRLLASYVPGGTVIALVLLAAAALLTGVSLVLRPPGTVPAAAARLALGLALATALMPATRFGYLVYPLVLGALAYRERHATRSVPEVPAERHTRAGAGAVA